MNEDFPKQNKWLNGAIPALLIHCSIGTVYCWSTFKETIADRIGMSTFSVGWAFSLAIFFLGISAAFGGKIVERNVHMSSFISCICFALGMCGTGFTLKYGPGGIRSLMLLYLFYGCIMGIGLGVGYITPVKTLMIWFKDKKGLATGLSIMGFGLAKAIATPIMEFLQRHYGIGNMFIILSIVYLAAMFAAHMLIEKPKWWKEISVEEDTFNVREFLKLKSPYLLIWIMFYLNIHCGLMIITCEKQIVSNFVLATTFKYGVILVTTIPMLSAIFNASGRFISASLSDLVNDKLVVYSYIFTSCVIVTMVSIIRFLITGNIIDTNVFIGMITSIMVINFGYGGGFSTLPVILSSKYGMKHISKIHGITLTAWSIAGLTGNTLSEFILKIDSKMNPNINPNEHYMKIFALLVLFYLINFGICAIVRNGYSKGKWRSVDYE